MTLILTGESIRFRAVHEKVITDQHITK